MPKRHIAALTVALVSLAVVAVVVVAILSGGDDQSGPATNAPKTPGSGGAEEPKSPPSNGSTESPSRTEIEERLAQRRTVAAPDVSLPVLDRGAVPGPLAKKLARARADGKLSLGELRGTPIVLNLWASWCDPCRPATRAVQTESQRLGPRGLLFLGLDVQDRDARARKFRSDLDLSYPTARDWNGEAARRLGATGVPETFFISGEGQIVGHIVGTASIAQLELGAMAAKAGKPLGIQQGGARLPLRLIRRLTR